MAQGFVNSGRLNALAGGSHKRNPVAPNVATFEELGVKGVDVDLWYAFFVHTQTSAPLVDRLNTEAGSILKLPGRPRVRGTAGQRAAAVPRATRSHGGAEREGRRAAKKVLRQDRRDEHGNGDAQRAQQDHQTDLTVITRSLGVVFG